MVEFIDSSEWERLFIADHEDKELIKIVEKFYNEPADINTFPNGLRQRGIEPIGQVFSWNIYETNRLKGETRLPLRLVYHQILRCAYKFFANAFTRTFSKVNLLSKPFLYRYTPLNSPEFDIKSSIVVFVKIEKSKGE